MPSATGWLKPACPRSIARVTRLSFLSCLILSYMYYIVLSNLLGRHGEGMDMDGGNFPGLPIPDGTLRDALATVACHHPLA